MRSLLDLRTGVRSLLDRRTGARSLLDLRTGVRSLLDRRTGVRSLLDRRVRVRSLLDRRRGAARVRRSLAVAASAATLLLTAHPVAASAPRADEAGAPVLEIVAPVLDIELATADVGGAARVEKRPDEIRVTLDSAVLFPKDSARLLPVASRRLKEIAADLEAAGTGAVHVAGYTDDLGSAAHGLDLSRRRAAAVAAVLRPLLPAADYPFRVVGRGEADPAVPNDSEVNRKLNRRVEITFRPR